MSKEMPLDEAIDKARMAGSQYRDVPSVSRTLVNEIDALRGGRTQMAHTLGAQHAQILNLKADNERFKWLIENGERCFGTLWKQATPADIDFMRNMPSSSASGEQSAKDQVMKIIAPLTDFDRVTVIDAIQEKYCIQCGDVQPEHGRRCQCWNDT